MEFTRVNRTTAPEAVAPATETVPPSRRGRRPFTVRRLAPYGYLSPTALLIIVLMVIPIVMVASYSFKDNAIVEENPVFTGLANYTKILHDGQFWHVVLRTIVFTAINVSLTMVLGTAIALLLVRLHTLVRILLTAGLVFVWATPVIPAINLWQWMFDYEFGVINWLLTRIGAGNYIHHNWFENPLQGFTVITVIVVWGAIPFLAIALNAALTQVPKDLVEAAEIDGAKPWQVFANVTVPVLRPTLLVLLSLSTIWDFGVFNQVWVLLNQRPSKDYFVMSVFSFQESFRVSQYGLGSAVAVVMIAILVLATFLYVRQTVRAVNEAG